MGYRVLRNSDSWARVVWAVGQPHAPAVERCLKALSGVPGVEMISTAGYIALPCTTWMLPAAVELWHAIGADAPQYAVRTAAKWDAPELFEHQAVGVDKILSVSGVLLGDDMGLGKTRTAIVAAERIRRYYGRPVLVVGPLSARDVWRRELEALGCDVRYKALQGRDIATGWDPAADWYFAHFDVVLAWMTKLQGRKPSVGIIDEAHYIKNGRTARGRGAAAVIMPTLQHILLTGTPIENRPSDIWHQLNVLTGQGTWGTPTAFRQRYNGALYDGYSYKDGEPTHVDELMTRLRPFYLRRTFKDVALSMPPLQRQLQWCRIHDNLQHEHDEVLDAVGAKQLVQALLHGKIQDVLPTLTRLRQITSAAKLEATCEYVLGAQQQGESVVVFVYERATADKIAARTKGFKLTGDDSQDVRTRTIDMFQSTPGSVLVATLGSLREAVTLHSARLIVMHDWHWVLAHMLQGEARVWRAGQRRACVSTWMIAEDSVDLLLARVLYAKALAMQTLENDSGREALEQLGVGQLARTMESDRVNQMLQEWL